MDAVAVSRAVTRLLRAGRIRRAIATDDRRRSVLRLSAAGESVYREIAPVALRYEHSLLEGLESAEVERLDALLSKLTTRAQALVEDTRTRRK
jgi:DNA-binding MarR family transcriptional regulator